MREVRTFDGILLVSFLLSAQAYIPLYNDNNNNNNRALMRCKAAAGLTSTLPRVPRVLIPSMMVKGSTRVK